MPTIQANTTLKLDSKAPEFTLLDMNDPKKQHKSLTSLKGKQGTLIIFMCNHCPYVHHMIPHLVQILCNIPQTIHTLGINVNDSTNYPEDSPEKMQEYAKKWGIIFPYLTDPTQKIAKNYGAKCTPEFYLFDQNLQLVYHGRYDDSSPSNGKPLTGIDLMQAIQNLCNHDAPTKIQHPSMGCSIKWLTSHK
jgi:peroxiredoxin